MKVRSIAAICAILCLILAVMMAVFVVVDAQTIQSLPVLKQLYATAEAVVDNAGLMMLGPLGSKISIIMLFLFAAIIMLALRKHGRHWWWTLAYAALLYTTVLMYSRLSMYWKSGEQTIRPAFLQPLADNPSTSLAKMLVILGFLLEIVVCILLVYLSRHLSVRYRKQVKPQKELVEEQKQPVEEGSEIPEPTKREIRLARKQRRALLKKERKRLQAEKKETDEEAVVTLQRPPTEEDNFESPIVKPVRTIDPDAPMVFPPLPDMPTLKTIGQRPNELPDEEEQTLEEEQKESPVQEDVAQKVFVGSIKILENQSVVLTETPIDEAEQLEPPPVDTMKKTKLYDPIANLRKKLAEDAQVARMTVPTALPERSLEVSTEEVETEPDEEFTQEPIIEPNKLVSAQKPETDVEEEDIEVAAGIGGLVSSNEGLSALLSRGKLSYQFPPDDLLIDYPNHSTEIDDDTRAAGENLIQTLAQFRIEANLANIVKGPTVTMYEISPAPGVRVSAITSLSDNIALQLAAQQVRIVAPIPGKQAVGIEVPNKLRSIIGFREMLSSIDSKPYNIPMVLGRTITGEPVVIDLTQTPHLLIAGATGSGKSVCVNSLISSILYRKSPRDVRLILVDPKIVELRIYNDIPHLLTPVITEAKKTIKALEFCQYEMERRYKLLNALAVRNLTAYNRKISELKLAREKLPYIVVVIDEFADLMVTVGKELETLLGRLAAMARAVGIHLVLATQRPSANVITGIIKSNIPARIAFMVASQIDSRIIIDEMGAEKLLGKGDMLFVSSWNPASIRIQGAFMSDDEVERVVAFAKTQGDPDYLDEAFFEEDDDHASSGDEEGDFDDGSDEALMEKALNIVRERQSASASYLQRRLKIGYNRAARLVEQMEDLGYVGPARGSKPRELIRLPD